MKKEQQFGYSMGVVPFLKQVRLVWIVISAGSVAAASAMWYVGRFGREFAESCGFCGLDVFFFCLGNYPEEWGEIWMPDHYLIALLPFLVLMQQLIFYVDSNLCERIYYISFRRGNMWKQAVHDFKRIIFIIVSWLFFWEWTEKIIFSFLYGWTENSFFIGHGLTLAEEFVFLDCVILRQVIILLLASIVVYGIMLWAGLVWGAVVMTGTVITTVFLGFTGIDSPFALNAISTQAGKPLTILLILLLILLSGRKHMKKMYLK